jgi:radical SAM superfamily enzyme YgiQ (UPF0313 family)
VTPAAHIALVGPMQQENLPLGYLAAAAQAAGHRATFVRFDTGDDRRSCLAELMRLEPDAIGLGISFQYAIGDYLGLVSSLRHRGYDGHVTCGGHVPTFCYEELLRDAPGIDSVVRHDGEETLVELLDALARGEAGRGIPGLVWRGKGGVELGPVRPPVEDLDRLAWPVRREVALRVGGVPIAFMLMARGCVGDCAYCSIRAFTRDSGGKPFRMRRPELVADEIAALYREKQARIFFVQDDLFVLRNQARTLERIGALGAAIRERGVEQALFWIKGRPESITGAVLSAARELGAIHMFLGIESASDERLSYLGRTHAHEHNRNAIALCREHRIRPSFNFMLFDPDCTLEDVATTVDFAGEHPDLPWNVCRTEIYSGTKLLDRLAAEGRLEGDYRTYGYRMTDDRAEVMFRVLRVCLHERAFAFDSLLNKLISLSFARQVHEELFPGPATDDLNRQVDGLIVEIHRDTVDELRRQIDFAASVDPGDTEQIREHAVRTGLEIGQRDVLAYDRCERLWRHLNARGEALFDAAADRGALPARQPAV